MTHCLMMAADHDTSFSSKEILKALSHDAPRKTLPILHSAAKAQPARTCAPA